MAKWTAIATAAALLAAGAAQAQAPVQAPAQTVSSQAGPIRVESLARLDNPWGMAFLPDGGLLITEKPGRLRIWSNGKLSAPIQGVPEVVFRGQGGLLDVAVDPDFAGTRYVYLSYSEAAKPQPPGLKDTRDTRLGQGQKLDDTVLKGGAVARGRLDGGSLRDVQVIWRQAPKTVGRGHFGGRLAFAPDGTLFITSGDRQRFEPAQDLKSGLGKVVRINRDGSVPPDNPFVDKPDVRPDVYSYGHRNALGAEINPRSGALWINEMGPKGGDEINVVQAGADYGWPLVSEGDHYDGTPIPRHSTQLGVVGPAYDWEPSVSPSGLAFYTGERFPWRGDVLLGALSGQALIRLTLDQAEVTGEERIRLGKRVRDVIQAPDGAVLLLTDGPAGELLRLTPMNPATPAS